MTDIEVAQDQEIPANIRQLFIGKIFEIIAYQPILVVLADYPRKQITLFDIGQRDSISFIRRESVVINAVPADIQFKPEENRYQINWSSKSGPFVTKWAQIHQIASELKRSGRIYDSRYGETAFTAILSALRRAGRINVTEIKNPNKIKKLEIYSDEEEEYYKNLR